MSRDLLPAPRPRCLAVWLLASGLLAGVALWLVPGLLDLRLDARFDVVLVDLCEAVLLGCAVWLWLATTVVARDAARGVAVRRRGVPRGLRRVVLVACGAALAGGLTAPLGAAYAGGGPLRAGDGNGSAAVVRGLPLPDRATAAGHLARLMRRQAERSVVVRPGDTLWGIATDRLGSGADWPRLYAANRAEVGPDPDLIHPGQRLALPDLREESP